MTEPVGFISTTLILLAALIRLISIDERANFGLLAVQYFGCFLLIQGQWPLNLSLAFILSGWIGTAILVMAQMGYPTNLKSTGLEAKGWQRARILISLVGILIILLSLSLAFSFTRWLFLNVFATANAMTLIGFGLIQLTYHRSISHTAPDLMSIVSGFELLISGLTSSIFIAGMFGVTTLLLALAGAYWVEANASPGKRY